MSAKPHQTVILEQDNARTRFAFAWKMACAILQLGKKVRVLIEEYAPKRSIEQNDKMWAMLHDIAAQVQWHVDGQLQLIAPEDWKDILTAGLKKTQRIAAGIEGGFVMLGQRTSKMKVAEMIELIEFGLWFGSEHGVVWSEPEQVTLPGDTELHNPQASTIPPNHQPQKTAGKLSDESKGFREAA